MSNIRGIIPTRQNYNPTTKLGIIVYSTYLLHNDESKHEVRILKTTPQRRQISDQAEIHASGKNEKSRKW